MERLCRIATKTGNSIWLDADKILTVEPFGDGRSRINLTNLFMVYIDATPDEVMRSIGAPVPATPTPQGDEDWANTPTPMELAALREKVRALEAVPDGFRDQHRRTEALKKARIYELKLLEQSAALSRTVWGHSDVLRYVDERLAEIERGGL